MYVSDYFDAAPPCCVCALVNRASRLNDVFLVCVVRVGGHDYRLPVNEALPVCEDVKQGAQFLKLGTSPQRLWVDQEVQAECRRGQP